MDQKNPPLEQVRRRCYGCFRPVAMCFCHAIPRIEHETEILILQHRAERTHPFNSARIVNQALLGLRLIVGRNVELAKASLPIHAGAGLLYPGKGSTLLSELPRERHPRQLVLLDGTWHHARTMMRDIPQLHALPCYRLSPRQPSQFRIRQEPSFESISTLEAVIQSLEILEPELAGLDQLMNAFNVMIQGQLDQLEARQPLQKTRTGE